MKLRKSFDIAKLGRTLKLSLNALLRKRICRCIISRVRWLCSSHPSEQHSVPLLAFTDPTFLSSMDDVNSKTHLPATFIRYCAKKAFLAKQVRIIWLLIIIVQGNDLVPVKDLIIGVENLKDSQKRNKLLVAGPILCNFVTRRFFCHKKKFCSSFSFNGAEILSPC